MYARCLRRRDNVADYTKQVLYEERLAVLRSVMAACRSGNPEARMAATEMTRTMSDPSKDETSPTSSLSMIQISNMLDGAQHAYEIGNQVANLVQSANATSSSSGSAHVDAVANALFGMIESENAEEEDPTSSDVEMEDTQSQRRERYLNSDMCECSDLEEWMLYHHVPSDESEDL